MATHRREALGGHVISSDWEIFKGHIREVLDSMVLGITWVFKLIIQNIKDLFSSSFRVVSEILVNLIWSESIKMAINQRKIIQASYGVTEVEDANINRSPSSYEKNDPEYLDRYARKGFYTIENSSHSRSRLLNWEIVCDSAILDPIKVMVILTRILQCYFLRMIMVPSVNSTGSPFIQQQWIIQIHW